MNELDRLLTIQEAAARLRVQPSFLYEATRRGGDLVGRPPIIRVGQYLRIREKDLEEFLKMNTLHRGMKS
jgi:excisionase family DNA binding protein